MATAFENTFRKPRLKNPASTLAILTEGFLVLTEYCGDQIKEEGAEINGACATYGQEK
jgi:hypothetical protein